MRFDFITNSRVHHIRSINSKNVHFNIFACYKLNISNVNLVAPATSPNTDGIHIGSSSSITIARSVISTGDDCIAMVSGSHDVDISDVTCGPGHGISIGSLGRSHTSEFVSGITVRNCTFIRTDNGVRIKTWGATSSRSLASNITFRDIVMKYVNNPVVIDQKYCPMPHCLYVITSTIIHSGRLAPCSHNLMCPLVSQSYSFIRLDTIGTEKLRQIMSSVGHIKLSVHHEQGNNTGDSAVQIKDVMFKNIWGTSRTKVAVNIQCSGAVPCKNVKLIDISLAYKGRGGPATAVCSNVLGSSYGKQIPDGCL